MTIRLITTHERKYNLENVKNYPSLTKLLEDAELSDKDTVIINTYEEDDYEAGILVGELLHQVGVEKLLYLSDNRSISLSSIISKNNGTVDTEEYLLDYDTLEVILDDLDSNQSAPVALTPQDLTKINAVEIIKSFYRDVSLGKLDLSNSSYLKTVRDAVDELGGNSEQIDKFISEVRDTVTNLYENTYLNLGDLSSELDSIKADYSKLSDKFETLQGTSSNSSSIQSFSSYNIANTYGTKFIVFKEYSAVRYLTSFIMGYKTHLENKLSKRVRLIFIIPNKFNWIEKYKNSPANMAHYAIENDVFRNEECLNNKVGFCEKPINKLYQYFSNLSDDYILIVDRVNEPKPSVIGKVNTFHCFSGKTEADIYPGTSEKRILTMKALTETDIVIPHVSDFPKLPSERMRLYDGHSSINKLYTRIDELADVKRI